MSRYRVAILTVSDRCSKREAEDTSGPALAALCQRELESQIVDSACIADEADEIERAIRAWANTSPAIDLVLTTGGTGLSPRDHTPEAAMRVIDRPHPALMELARLRCLEKTPRTFLSRGVAGAAKGTLILTLPGSLRGSTEMLEALVDILPHALDTLRGDVADG